MTKIEQELLTVLKRVEEYLHAGHATGECFETGCTCEGNEKSKALMDAIEGAIAKAEGK